MYSRAVYASIHSPYQRRHALPRDVILILNRHTLGHVVDLVNPNQPLCKLEHVIPQTDDNELCVLRALFDVSGNNGNLGLVSKMGYAWGDVGVLHF